ncbi:MAG: class I SAM-dependent methyltransferase [Oceanospirillaceae bacterium]|nr:class I SAM-dependent methyltransferase [Oceanospirillaceae bacterium]
MNFNRENLGSSDLEKYFNTNDQRLIHKWNHYFDIYERHFSRYRKRPLVILEIGIFHGGSLQMWKNYFGDEVEIYGVDINPKCKKLEEENIRIYIGSQSDRQFLRQLKSQIPPIDILIDDGGHGMRQQIVTFEELFDHVKADGIYLCEDTHSSYMLEHGGGFKRRGSFIEYTKNFIDYIHAYHSQQRGLQPNFFTKNVDSVHYYDSIVVIEKKKREAPIDKKSGKESYPSNYHIQKTNLKRFVLTLINKILRFFRLPGIFWS